MFPPQVIEEDGCQATAARVGGVFMKEMIALRDEFEVVGDVRGKGLMLGIEFVKNKVRNLIACAVGMYCVAGGIPSSDGL